MDTSGKGAHLDAELLCDYAEGLLAPAAHREAEGHLAACADCRRELAAVRGYFREMKSLEPMKAPDRFLTKVHGRIAQDSPWRRLLAALSSPRLLPVPLAGLAVLLMGVYFFWLSPQLAEQAPQTVALSQERSAQQPKTELLMKSEPAPAQEPALAPAAPPPAAAPAPSADERIARYEMPRQKAKKSAEGAETSTTREIIAFADKAQAESRDDGAAGSRREGLGAVAGGGKDAGASGLGLAAESKKNDAQPGRAPTAAAPAKEEQEKRIASAPVTAARRSQRAAAAPPEPAATPPVPAVAAKPKAVEKAASEPSQAAKISAVESDEEESPWSPVAYDLRWAGSATGAAFRSALADSGVRILRSEAGRVELEVSPAKVPSLEARLRALGPLKSVPAAFPSRPAGAPLRLTVRVLRP